MDWAYPPLPIQLGRQSSNLSETGLVRYRAFYSVDEILNTDEYGSSFLPELRIDKTGRYKLPSLLDKVVAELSKQHNMFVLHRKFPFAF